MDLLTAIINLVTAVIGLIVAWFTIAAIKEGIAKRKLDALKTLAKVIVVGVLGIALALWFLIPELTTDKQLSRMDALIISYQTFVICFLSLCIVGSIIAYREWSK